MFDCFISPAIEFVSQEIQSNVDWLDTVIEYYDSPFDFVSDVVTNGPSALPDALHSFYDTLRDDLIQQDPATETVTFPAFARGIGYARISDGSTQGYHIADGTIYLPEAFSADQSVTLFSAEGGAYRAVLPAGSVMPQSASFRRLVGGNYYYTNIYSNDGQSNSGMIDLYWSGTKVGTYSNAYITGGQSTFYPQYPATFSNFSNYMCRLKYWTFNTYGGSSPPSVTNIDGEDVPDTVTVYNVPIGGTPITYNDYSVTIYNIYNDEHPDATLPSESVPDWEQTVTLILPEMPSEPTEPVEPTEPATDSSGNIIINNYDTLNFENNISGDQSVEINGEVDVDITAGAGAFGAGAFASGAFADLDVNIDTGAFGAGAFAAGAIGQVDVSGAVNIDSFILNMDGSLDVPEITLHGATINQNSYDGATITQNNYTITVESGGTVELPSYPTVDFTLDYDEILSEKELELILNSETYYIPEYDTGLFMLDADALPDTLPAVEPLDSSVVTGVGAITTLAFDIFDTSGFLSLYIPLSLLSLFIMIFRGR